MNIYSVYKATCAVTGKSYIGFDSNWPNRKYNHKLRSKEPKYHLHQAIKKYGWDSFEWEVLYQSLDKDHTLKVIEPYFIEQYDSYNNGYNMTPGGEGTFGRKLTEEHKHKLFESTRNRIWSEEEKLIKRNFRHSEETKKKLSEKNTGRKHSPEAKLKMSETHKGKTLPEEQKQKMSQSQKDAWARRKQVE